MSKEAELSKQALPNVSGDHFFLDSEWIEQGIRASRSSSRRRVILPIHREQEALVQRMLNFMQPGTYVQPHLHPKHSASETILTVQGRLGFIIFDAEGKVKETFDLKKGCLLDIEPSIWHGMVALEEDTVILELKRGPYDNEDKVFAEWAPGEGEDGADAHRQRWEELF